MECAKDVVLHVYELQPSGNASFFSRMLGSLGHGAYHTSLEVDGYRYTFAANVGIVKTASRNEGVPPGATYKEAIPLGSCSCTRGEVRPMNSCNICVLFVALFTNLLVFLSFPDQRNPEESRRKFPWQKLPPSPSQLQPLHSYACNSHYIE
jgi:hypothetical protein